MLAEKIFLGNKPKNNCTNLGALSKNFAIPKRCMSFCFL
jgi:hypothetical protein